MVGRLHRASRIVGSYTRYTFYTSHQLQVLTKNIESVYIKRICRFDFGNSIKLAKNELGTLDALLGNQLQGNSSSKGVQEFDIIFRGSEIPTWFNHQNDTGSSISFSLLEHLPNGIRRLLGYAYFVVIGADSFGDDPYRVSRKPFHVRVDFSNGYSHHSNPFYIKLGHECNTDVVLIVYNKLPIGIELKADESGQLKASFVVWDKTCYEKVRKCAVRLVYMEDDDDEEEMRVEDRRIFRVEDHRTFPWNRDPFQGNFPLPPHPSSDSEDEYDESQHPTEASMPQMSFLLSLLGAANLLRINLSRGCIIESIRKGVVEPFHYYRLGSDEIPMGFSHQNETGSSVWLQLPEHLRNGRRRRLLGIAYCVVIGFEVLGKANSYGVSQLWISLEFSNGCRYSSSTCYLNTPENNTDTALIQCSAISNGNKFGAGETGQVKASFRVWNGECYHKVKKCAVHLLYKEEADGDDDGIKCGGWPPHQPGDDDLSVHDEEESDGGDTGDEEESNGGDTGDGEESDGRDTGSPASQDHHNHQHPFTEAEDGEMEKREDASSVRSIASENGKDESSGFSPVGMDAGSQPKEDKVSSTTLEYSPVSEDENDDDQPPKEASKEDVPPPHRKRKRTKSESEQKEGEETPPVKKKPSTIASEYFYSDQCGLCNKKKRVNGENSGCHGMGDKQPCCSFLGFNLGNKNYVDQGVEVLAVHRKGSFSGGGGVFMEYEFFPPGTRGNYPFDSKNLELATTDGESSAAVRGGEGSCLAATPTTISTGFNEASNSIDLSLKLSY